MLMSRQIQQAQQPQQALSAQQQGQQDVCNTPIATPALELIESFFMASHLLHRLAERGVGPTLSGPRTRVLMEVGRAAHPLRMNEVAAELGITARTITTLIDALEQDGLLARQPDPTDRRATLLTLTEQGKAQVKQLATVAERVSESLLASLQAPQRQQLRDILRQLIGHAQSQR